MARRINVILDEAAWLALQEVPKGERSKLISAAIKQLVESRRRTVAAQTMDVLRKDMPMVAEEDIVSWLRTDRTR